MKTILILILAFCATGVFAQNKTDLEKVVEPTKKESNRLFSNFSPSTVDGENGQVRKLVGGRWQFVLDVFALIPAN